MYKYFLITTVSHTDPYLPLLFEEDEQLGPVLNLFYEKKWEVLVLCVAKGLEDIAKNIVTKIKESFTDCNIFCVPIRNDKKKNIIDDLEMIWKTYCQKQTQNIYLGLNPDAPLVNSSWIDVLKDKNQKIKLLAPKIPFYNIGYSTPIFDYEKLKSKNNILTLHEEESIFEDDVLQKIGLIGDHPLFRQAIETTCALAEHNVPIMIYGETGTGKDLIARLIHNLSPRRHQKLIAMNCAAIPESLSESILFGHKKGAFTGAIDHSLGKFRAADQSTLFLDEIGELPLKVQANLLRTLESGLVEPVGMTESISVNVRIIGATHRNLKKEIQEGRFREDLYYRLNIGVIYIPPLRDRMSDLPKLTNSILTRINRTLRYPKQISDEALSSMTAYDWPGNVRELQNTIERAILVSRDNVIEPKDLFPQNNANYSPIDQLPEPMEGFCLESYMGRIRNKIIQKALRSTKGNQSKAAKLLGMTPQAVNKFTKTFMENENN